MKKIFCLVFISISILLITGCSFGGEYKEAIQKNIGEEMTCSEYEKYSVVVNSYGFKTSNDDLGYIKVPDGEEWVGIIVTVKNTGDEEMQFAVNNFNLINSNGEIISPDNMTWNVWNATKMDNVKLSKGGTSTGYIAFSNPNTDNSNLKLEFVCDRNGFISTDDTKYEIPLK